MEAAKNIVRNIDKKNPWCFLLWEIKAKDFRPSTQPPSPSYPPPQLSQGQHPCEADKASIFMKYQSFIHTAVNR